MKLLNFAKEQVLSEQTFCIREHLRMPEWHRGKIEGDICKISNDRTIKYEDDLLIGMSL